MKRRGIVDESFFIAGVALVALASGVVLLKVLGVLR